MRQEVEAEAARLELRQVQDAHRELDEREAARRQRHEERAREAKETRAEAQRRQESERTRAEREAVERRTRDERAARRRALIQEAKGVVNEVWVPSDVKAEALQAIERGLDELAVDEIPRAELYTLARGFRDRVVRPYREAEERAARERKEAEDRRFQEQINKVVRDLEASNQKADAVRRGMEYADRELEEERQAGLDYFESARTRQAVESALERRVTGQESDEALEELVDRILDRELP